MYIYIYIYVYSYTNYTELAPLGVAVDAGDGAPALEEAELELQTPVGLGGHLESQ